jgi:nicotinate-nucleotide adenylyltransferase
MKVIKAKVSSFSSTMIRNGIFLNKFDSRIINYINEHLLYIKDKLKFNLNNDQKRIKHSLFTGKTAFKLAKFYNQNPYKAKLAGFFHDITKN